MGNFIPIHNKRSKLRRKDVLQKHETEEQK